MSSICIVLLNFGKKNKVVTFQTILGCGVIGKDKKVLPVILGSLVSKKAPKQSYFIKKKPCSSFVDLADFDSMHIGEIDPSNYPKEISSFISGFQDCVIGSTLFSPICYLFKNVKHLSAPLQNFVQSHKLEIFFSCEYGLSSNLWFLQSKKFYDKCVKHLNCKNADISTSKFNYFISPKNLGFIRNKKTVTSKYLYIFFFVFLF